MMNMTELHIPAARDVGSAVMEKAYDILRPLTIPQLEQFIAEAPILAGRDMAKGTAVIIALKALDLAIYQARETIRRKRLGLW